jgi:hypothetical protein
MTLTAARIATIFAILALAACSAWRGKAGAIENGAAPEPGVRLRLGNPPALLDAEGRPFVAKGAIYYQPQAAHHYFLERLDLARVPADLAQLKAIGFNTLGIDVGWGELVAEADPANHYLPTRLHQDRIDKLTAFASLAREAGFFLYISPGVQIVPPQIPAKEFPACHDDSGAPHAAFKGYYVNNWLVDPEVNLGFEAYLRLMGEILRPFDNVVGYALYFEMMELQFPWVREEPLLQARWRDYLRDRNPDLNFWNQRWGGEDGHYASFDEIQLPMRVRDYWTNYYEQKKIQPRESSPAMWRDCFDFLIVGIGRDGRYGLSFPRIAAAIRAGDPGALLIWKAQDPIRYAWELGYLEEWKAGRMPPEAQAIVDTAYDYPGIDMIAIDGYPNPMADPAARERELSFAPNAERTDALIASIGLIASIKHPVFCQEFGIDGYQWTQQERARYLVNALKYYQSHGFLGYNLWQNIDYFGGGTWDKIQPLFGILDLQGQPYAAVEAIRPLLTADAPTSR